VAEDVDAKPDSPSDDAQDEELVADDATEPLGLEDDRVPEEVQEDTDVSGLLDVEGTKED
jgi:hypothetical protein